MPHLRGGLDVSRPPRWLDEREVRAVSRIVRGQIADWQLAYVRQLARSVADALVIAGLCVVIGLQAWGLPAIAAGLGALGALLMAVARLGQVAKLWPEYRRHRQAAKAPEE